MGNSISTYEDTAWGYDNESIGIDPDTGYKFKPTQKELDLFVQDKRTMYKGTFMICLVYGISALLLLTLIFFTEWGKTYVYDRFLPAIITYVVGAIFIIIYLLFAIFALKPRKITREFDELPICPDYWIQVPVDSDRIKSIVDNNNENIIIGNNSNGTSYVNVKSAAIANKCIPDPKVFGSLDRYRKMRDDLDKPKNQLYMASQFQNLTEAQKSRDLYNGVGGASTTRTATNLAEDENKLRSTLDFLYNEIDAENRYINGGLPSSVGLGKYAQFVGSYNDNTADGATDKKAGTLYVDEKKTYTDTKPLICSEVFPKVLDNLEADDSKDDLKCEFAEACNISWSKLDCYKDSVIN
jgi:hypothetical protein